MYPNYNTALTQTQATQHSGLEVTMEMAKELEKSTRLQATDPKWHKLRYDRITASKAGEIYKRRRNFETLVERYKTTRHYQTEAMKHGVLCEPKAAKAYSEVMNNTVNILPCGIVINPWCPWLAASPDRKVYNPQRTNPFGLLEIKCPDVHSVKDVQYLEQVWLPDFPFKRKSQLLLSSINATGSNWSVMV
ncbi:uncharacterized protein LOC114576043 [Exaiptasia diaphana]|uniref:YqaJ viral recombinase domain-containing protein n=1 Tax=Exaiptasia diaphana TaxID=2652724 RepID=A0A913YQR6_EXADI|nr:uncharacterized protein LOC114576043 [Exaiptasia diaphana]